ncbi:YgiQ family radical SAM protein [Lachnospira multipara]|uniref:YgiQ family radical SAM protein n=1 Tax=Lachnospira multipara TaxID=28051 RepID=UPI0009DFD6A8|nr:YgiQ family radical SAM protein [Lachnospira multipara]
MNTGFLPITREEMLERGWDQVDFVYVCGDAYVDHPSFGASIITRVLEANGYKIGFIAQPDWKNPESINVFGKPRLGFLVSSGNMDSLVNHYTVAKKHRSTDAFTPGGVMGKRPDRAVIVYCNLIRQTYKKDAIIIGGLEASLRRMGHYDYWSDSVRRSILLESGADIISYGMGEHSIVEIADALNSGLDVKDVTFIKGTVYKTRDEDSIYDAIRLPDFETIENDKREYARSFALQYKNTDPFQAKTMYECYGGKTFVVQNPPALPLSELEMDDVYKLPYMRAYHPSYEAAGGVPALQEIKFSLTSNRGCYGECNFCALTMHEGRIVQARSHESIITEAKQMIEDPDFKGYIHDVGGPTAEFRAPACSKQMTKGACVGKRCLYPKPCINLNVDHSDYLSLLRKLRKLQGVKKVFVRSGFRYDYLVADKNKDFLKELCQYHVSGQLRVAPEHISDNVLSKMGKPGVEIYNEFVKEFEKINKDLNLKQYIVPYLMSSHPGSRLEDAIMLAQYLKKHHISPEQVQDFYPTPGTVSTTMYYTGLDPFTLEPVFVEHNPHKKAMQRALIQYWKPENYDIVKEALKEAGREDLIGFGEECLIPPRKMTYTYKLSKGKDKNKNNNEHNKDKYKSKDKSKNRSKDGAKPAKINKKINNKESNRHKKTR